MVPLHLLVWVLGQQLAEYPDAHAVQMTHPRHRQTPKVGADDLSHLRQRVNSTTLQAGVSLPTDAIVA